MKDRPPTSADVPVLDAAAIQRALRRVDGERGEGHPQRGELACAITVPRQLAETERSPVAAVEDQDERLLGAEVGDERALLEGDDADVDAVRLGRDERPRRRAGT